MTIGNPCLQAGLSLNNKTGEMVIKLVGSDHFPFQVIVICFDDLHIHKFANG